MGHISRREACKRLAGFVIATTAGTSLAPLLSACSDRAIGHERAAQIQKELQSVALDKIKLTIIYDNYPHQEGLQTDWGFACLIEGLDRTILFDSGRYDSTLMSNMDKLSIDPRSFEELFISHDHPDHIGGVFKLLDRQPNMRVSLIKSFRGGFKKAVAKRGATVVAVKEPALITKNVVSTGEMKDFVKNEHALILSTDQGAILITGCAHPNVADMVARAKAITKMEVLLVMGGFHLMMHDGPSIEKIAKRFAENGVRHVAPTHCSGETARTIFADLYGKRFIHGGVGRVITAKDLSAVGSV